MGIHRRVVCVVALAVIAVVAVPAAALGQDDGDGGDGGNGSNGQVLTPTVDPVGALPQLLTVVADSLDAATQSPDTPFVGEPGTQTYTNGTSVQASSRMTSGMLHSEFVIQGDGARTVASVDANVCPDAGGRVSARIKASDSQPNVQDPREIAAVATGQVNDDAKLTSPNVHVVTGTGKEKALLERIGHNVLQSAQKAWRGGLCVAVEVTEGNSTAVAPKAKVRISAVGRPRFGGGEIKGRMEAHRTAGEKKVEPATVHDSPAKFTYTAPDKRPKTGEVTLASVSRRGVGFAVLEYTTEGDLKINSSGVTSTKCGGPEGAWSVHFTPMGPGTGDYNATFTLAPGTLSGPYAFGGYAVAPEGVGSNQDAGTATYTASDDGKSGTLTFSDRGSYPVTVGTYPECAAAAPSGG